MSKKNRAPRRAQVSGQRKNDLIQRIVQDASTELDPDIAEAVIKHLCDVIEVVQSSPAMIERYASPKFNPNAFSALKLYRASGEAALRATLSEIATAAHLRQLATAQQIALPSKLKVASNADLDALRSAIIEGVKKRQEDWLAASL